ncbi:hypothetical protein PGT21_003845 [Puccinia graminis f. sp. tritici]|uniref:Uncharacterized protein n=1 Tax=Puccinia graminis f. sp. tritici TaxID=56615 RepID=A0A5B0P3D1_PUCGR|nr:hypothetical protein PGT21_003845 [Puccinia graminis f. sp. tritici]
MPGLTLSNELMLPRRRTAYGFRMSPFHLTSNVALTQNTVQAIIAQAVEIEKRVPL